MESMWINFSHVIKFSLLKILGQAGAASLMAQTKMSGFLKQKAAPMSKEKYTRLTRSLVQMCAIDLRPLSITEGDGFRYYYKKLWHNTIVTNIGQTVFLKGSVDKI